MLSSHALDQETAEATIAAHVEAIRCCPARRAELAGLLAERHPLYTGRGTNAVVRIRGYILASFEQVGLPEESLPYVLEELESGRDAYLVAAAARALRGYDGSLAWSLPYLLTAIENIQSRDDALSFETYQPQWPLPRYTTALAEIFTTLAALGGAAQAALPRLATLFPDPGAHPPPTRLALAHALTTIRDADDAAGCGCCTGQASGGPMPAPPRSAHCCDGMPATGAESQPRQLQVPTSVVFEDQGGRNVAYGTLFSGRPAIVTFFYTRCDNPSKCSLSITRMGHLQHAIRAAGLHEQLTTAAITYDPEYDLPPRLRAYGHNRGFIFDEHNRILRTTQGFSELQSYFELGVSFGQALVNRHRVELFIFDDTGRIADAATRLQWDVNDVLRRATSLLPPGN